MSFPGAGVYGTILYIQELTLTGRNVKLSHALVNPSGSGVEANV
jgi:hypothetical protein